MTFDNYKRVKFNDGQEAILQDLNDAQDFLLARLNDQLLGVNVGFGTGFIGGSIDPDVSVASAAGPDLSWAYTPNPSQAFLRAGSATNKVQLSQGTLLQLIAVANGNFAQFVPYTFDGSTLFEWTVAAGSATNPRVDLLQMSLTYVDDDLQNRVYDSATPPVTLLITNSLLTKRRVACTLTVKQGTPAASPFIPEPDAGCVAVGMVSVSASYVTSTQLLFGDVGATNAGVYDLRMPMGVRSYRSDPLQFKLDNSWIITGGGNNGRYAANNNATNSMSVWYPGPAAGRIIGIGLMRKVTASFAGTFNFVCEQDPVLGTSAIMNHWVPRCTVVGLPTEDIQAYHQIEASHAPSIGAVIQQSIGNAKYGCPIWGTGVRGYQSRAQLGGPNGAGARQLAFVFTNTPLTWNQSYVTWYVAEGL